MSRQNFVPIDGTPQICLIPFWDMLNHAQGTSEVCFLPSFRLSPAYFSSRSPLFTTRNKAPLIASLWLIIYLEIKFLFTTEIDPTLCSFNTKVLFTNQIKMIVFLYISICMFPFSVTPLLSISFPLILLLAISLQHGDKFKAAKKAFLMKHKIHQ